MGDFHHRISDKNVKKNNVKLIRYIALIFLLWGIDSFALFMFGETIGSLASYATYAIILGYYILSYKRKLMFPIIILGLTYFVISGVINLEDYNFFINEFIKYFLIVICGAELARDTSTKELIYFLLVGAISILIHSLLFADDYGRYSGFYLNPNGAAFVCLIGYCLIFSIQNIKIKFILIFLFTFTGALTFSRFFFLMWVIITLISVIGDKKNIQILFVGIGALILLISYSAILQVNSERFELLLSFFNNDLKNNTLIQDARTSTWAAYYKDIINNPIFGNGYKSFSGINNIKQGVHNTYLMVIGEAGIIPLIIMLGIYFGLIKKSIQVYKTETYKFLLAFTLSAILLTMHNYFNNELIVFITIWLYVKLMQGESKFIITKIEEAE